MFPGWGGGKGAGPQTFYIDARASVSASAPRLRCAPEPPLTDPGYAPEKCRFASEQNS